MFTPRERLTQLTPAEFKRLHLNEPPDADPLLEYGLRYHRECEAFDQTVCSRKGMHGIAMPATNEERGLVNRNAKDTFFRISCELATAGLASADNKAFRMQDAIHMAHPAFAREWDRQQYDGSKERSRAENPTFHG